MATIDNLVIEIEGNATQASVGIDRLKASLEGLRTATSNFRSLNVVSKSIENIKNSLVGFDGTAAQSLNLMTDALSKLEGLGGVKLSTSIASQLKSIADVTRDLGGVDWSQIKVMADSLVPIAGIQKSNGLNNTVNALRKMPEAIKGINSLNPEIIAEFTERVEQLRVAIHPLADEMRAVSAGFSALPANIQKAIKANQKLTSSTEKTTRSFGSLLSRVVSLGAAYYGFRKLFSFAMDAFEASNNFIESLNLAEVAMGEGSKAAVEYAEKVERLAGIDMSKWITQVGTFNQQLEGFGIPADKANQMAQMLTQLGYDIQSAFNVSDLSTVMDRLSSGISGQIKGMRSYGVELSVAAMQEFALQHGITQTWSSMSQAQKVALRYAKIMEQTTNIQGDLARTIITPANSLRILQSQFGIAERYIGQIVSVIAAKVIPVFSAIAQVSGMAAKAIASFFGFTLPDISTSVDKGWGGAVDGAEDLEDAIGGAGGAAKEAKNEIKGLLAGWDEINIIQQKNESPAGTGGGGGGGAGGAIGDLLDIGQYSYDFLDGIKNKTDKILKPIKQFLSDVAGWLKNWTPTIKGIVAGLAALFVAEKLSKFITTLVDGLMHLSKGSKIALGVASIVAGFVTLKDTFYAIMNGGSWSDYWGNMAVGMLELVGGGALAGAAVGGPVGAVIGGLLGIVGALGALNSASDKFNADKLDKKFKSLFGDVHLTEEQIESLVNTLYTTDFDKKISLQLEGYEEASKNLADARTALNDLTTKGWLVKLGVGMSEGEKAAFLSEVQTAADSLSGWIKESGTSVMIALSLAYGEDSEQVRTASSFISDNTEYIEGLGNQASELFNTAFEKGLFSVEGVDAFEAGMEIVRKMNEIQGVVDAAMSEAEYQSLLNSFDLSDLDYETTMGFAQQLQDFTDQRVENIRKASEEYIKTAAANLAISELRLNKDPQNEELRAQKEYWQNEVDTYWAGTNPVKIKYDAEMELKEMRSSEDIRGLFETYLKQAIGPMGRSKLVSYDVLDALSQTGTDYADDVNEALEDSRNAVNDSLHGNWLLDKAGINSGMDDRISDDVRNAIEEYYTSAFESIQKDREVVNSARKAGEAVSEEMVSAINDFSFYGALLGKDDFSEEYFQGMEFAQGMSLKAFDALSKAELDGANIADAYKEGFRNNIEFTEDELGNLFVDIGDIGKYAFGDLTPEFRENLRTLTGMALPEIEGFSQSLADSIMRGVPLFKIVEGMLAEGFEAVPEVDLTDFNSWFESVTGEKPVIEVEPTISEDADLTSFNAWFDSVQSGNGGASQLPAIDTDTLYKPSLTQAEIDAATAKENMQNNLAVTAPAPDLSAITNEQDDVLNRTIAWHSQMSSLMNFGGTRFSGFGGTIRPSYGTAWASLAGNTNRLPTLTIPAYATGGFPTEGQLFIANEQGPELVGRMGGSTAVANGSQIISGITEGVSRGQEEQNRLLREQNDLLRRMLAKDNSVVLRPSAEMGRLNQRSYELFKEVRG